MIDIATETMLTFRQAADWLPRRRQGKKTSTTTLWRWCEVGIRGIRLETIFVGGVRCTSKEALQRFGEAISAARAAGQAPNSQQPTGQARTETRRRQDSERAGKEVDTLLAQKASRGRRGRVSATAK